MMFMGGDGKEKGKNKGFHSNIRDNNDNGMMDDKNDKDDRMTDDTDPAAQDQPLPTATATARSVAPAATNGTAVAAVPVATATAGRSSHVHLAFEVWQEQ
jgi:hypothetical protein